MATKPSVRTFVNQDAGSYTGHGDGDDGRTARSLVRQPPGMDICVGYAAAEPQRSGGFVKFIVALFVSAIVLFIIWSAWLGPFLRDLARVPS
jgi:hypothetical protein